MPERNGERAVYTLDGKPYFASDYVLEQVMITNVRVDRAITFAAVSGILSAIAIILSIVL